MVRVPERSNAVEDGMGLLDRFGAVVNPGLARAFRFMGLDAVEASGHGAVLVDEQGTSFLDMGSGYGVMVHGYGHPRLVAAAERQLHRLSMSSRVLLNRPMVELAELLAQVTPGDLSYSFFVNSGAEAVEAALKFARAATGRSGFVSMTGAFHGKTFGALSVSGRDLYQHPFRPLLSEVSRVPYGDLAAARAAVNERTAAVIVEPIQGEGGVMVPPDGYLRGLRRLCDDAGALLIADEIQTGMGRTGRLLAIEWEGVVPDLLVLAKALGGGIVPIGAVVGRPAAFEFFDAAPLIHTSTFGGNPLACAVAQEAIRVILDEDLPRQAEIKGAWLTNRLEDLRRRYPRVIAAVRGRGLMIGIEGVTAGVGGALMAAMFQRHVLVIHTLNNEKVIRLLPPLVIEPAQLEQAWEALEASVAEVDAMGLEE
jgi:putrescine aminotransferase